MNIRHDTRTMLLRSGWTVKRLAEEAKVNASALSRYLGMKQHGQTITEKIIPFVYGERTPAPLAHALEQPMKDAPPSAPPAETE